MSTNPKSDVAAKEAFRRLLLAEGYETAEVTGSPADITATKGRKTHYFEIKKTSKSKRYFGAATLTEWEMAINNPTEYWFVIASENTHGWQFRRFTPNEFMAHSYIPPFKVYFNVAMDPTEEPKRRGRRTRIDLTRSTVGDMVELYRRMKSASNKGLLRTGDPRTARQSAEP